MAGGAGTWRGTGGMASQAQRRPALPGGGGGHGHRQRGADGGPLRHRGGEERGHPLFCPAGRAAIEKKEESHDCTGDPGSGRPARGPGAGRGGYRQEKRRSGGGRQNHRGPAGGDPGGQRRRSGGGHGRRTPPRPAGPAGAGRGPHRRHCGGGAAGGRPPRSHRGGDQNGHPAQWTDHRKAPGPPGGDRHHLRGPAQRDGGRRSPLPQVGQRGAPPGRQGGLPLQPGLCGRPAGRPGGGRPAPGLRGPGGRYQPGERQRADAPDGVPGRAHPPGRAG